MKLAWVTHRDIFSNIGGAEAADREMLSTAPDDYSSIDLFKPGGVDETLVDYDRVVVTGLHGFTGREINILARSKPILWMHDVQSSGHWLYGDAKIVVALTPQHREYELEKAAFLRPERVLVNPGYMNITNRMVPDIKDQGLALWAHRPEPHKGLDLATAWAEEHQIKLRVMVGERRETVIEAMRGAQYFVLLSHIFDPGPRAVMEAQLCGCEIVVNDEVGWFDEDRDILRQRLIDAPKEFWEAVAA